MRTSSLSLFFTLVSCILGSSTLSASKVIYLKPLDESFIEIYLKDGETWFRDDGKGPSAFDGHGFADGDDKIISFGEELDPAMATQPERWLIKSADDANYGAKGKHPVGLSRKAKTNNTDHAWNYKLDHWLFLEVPSPLQQGSTYELVIDPELGIEVEDTTMLFDVFAHSSEAVHVNLIGYPQGAPIKSADLYRWMGDGGGGHATTPTSKANKFGSSIRPTTRVMRSALSRFGKRAARK